MENFNQGFVSLSFDDGWKNHYTRALPILEKYKIKATFYVITKMPKYMLEEGEGRMNVEDWIDLEKRGHEIGSHTRTHPHLSFCFSKRLKNEITGSKEDLVSIGINAKTFAYPYGSFNLKVVQSVKDAGYIGARAFHYKLGYGFNYKNENKHLFKTQAVVWNSKIDEVIGWIEKAVAEKSWLILSFHQVENKKNEWGTSPEILEKICQYISDKKIKTLTVADGIKMLD